MSNTDTDGDPAVDRSWNHLYVIGAVAALVALAGTLADIVITSIPGWQASTVPTSIEQWFAQFQANPLLGLRNLDLLNITISAVGLSMYVALYGVHRKVSQGYATLALVVVALGTAVFVSNNAALPMLDLSRQFSAAKTEAQRVALEGAGQALLARGAHGSLESFAGFFLSSVGTLLMACAMLQGKAFSRLAAYTGIIGISLLLAYVVGSTCAWVRFSSMESAGSFSGHLTAMAVPVQFCRTYHPFSRREWRLLNGWDLSKQPSAIRSMSDSWRYRKLERQRNET